MALVTNTVTSRRCRSSSCFSSATQRPKWVVNGSEGAFPSLPFLCFSPCLTNSLVSGCGLHLFWSGGRRRDAQSCGEPTNATAIVASNNKYNIDSSAEDLGAANALNSLSTFFSHAAVLLSLSFTGEREREKKWPKLYLPPIWHFGASLSNSVQSDWLTFRWTTAIIYLLKVDVAVWCSLAHSLTLVSQFELRTLLVMWWRWRWCSNSGRSTLPSLVAWFIPISSPELKLFKLIKWFTRITLFQNVQQYSADWWKQISETLKWVCRLLSPVTRLLLISLPLF